MVGVRYMDGRRIGGVHLSREIHADAGPYLCLVAAAVRLARRDFYDPTYSDEVRAFLVGPLVETFAECIGFGGSFADG